jgi:Arc/MetJ-type ribon-helix-helix transcriptional regulator
MARPKLTRVNVKDHTVTVRLDDATYQQLKEAMELGTITNLSEALRSMIRQRLWQERLSKEMERDLKSGDLSEKDWHGAVQRIWEALKSGSVEDRKSAKLEGFLEGLFSAFGGFVRRAVEELDAEEGNKKNREASINHE